MKTYARKIPCHPVVNGLPTMLDFTGFDVGPFFIHQSLNDSFGLKLRGNWTVTHSNTGFAVKRMIRSRQRAVSLAKALSGLDCWDFSEPDGVKNIPKESLLKIRELAGVAA